MFEELWDTRAVKRLSQGGLVARAGRDMYRGRPEVERGEASVKLSNGSLAWLDGW